MQKIDAIALGLKMESRNGWKLEQAIPLKINDTLKYISVKRMAFIIALNATIWCPADS